jgi:seryl-tRNA synthetase
VLDPKLLRSDLTGVAAALARRGFALDVAAFAALEERRKAVQIDADRLRAERNANAKILFHALTIKLYHIIKNNALILTD